MYSSYKNQIISKMLGASAIAAALALSAAASAQSTDVGTTYSPSGADFTISALQGIDASNPTGNFGTAQVDLNFEFNPSIGVAYTGQDGKLKDFGIGLYSNQGGDKGPAESTGLMVTYNSLVNASTANLTVEDFDLDNNATGFKPEKVTPLMQIYGSNNQLIGTATPSQIFSAMMGNAKDDVWTVNVGTLLKGMGDSSNQGISKVLLYADSANGEKTNSDPYLLKAVGNAQPVPEPFSLCGLGAGALFLIRRRRSKTSA